MNYPKLTSKGQVTIPRPIREFLGIRPSDRVGYAIERRGRVVLFPVRGDIYQLRGSVKSQPKHAGKRGIRELVKGRVVRHIMGEG